MPQIEVILSEQDILRACKLYAVTRVLNEGDAVRVLIGQCEGRAEVVVTVETERMTQQEGGE